MNINDWWMPERAGVEAVLLLGHRAATPPVDRNDLAQRVAERITDLVKTAPPVDKARLADVDPIAARAAALGEADVGPALVATLPELVALIDRMGEPEAGEELDPMSEVEAQIATRTLETLTLADWAGVLAALTD